MVQPSVKPLKSPGLLRFARNDGKLLAMTAKSLSLRAKRSNPGDSNLWSERQSRPTYQLLIFKRFLQFNRPCNMGSDISRGKEGLSWEETV